MTFEYIFRNILNVGIFLALSVKGQYFYHIAVFKVTRKRTNKYQAVFLRLS